MDLFTEIKEDVTRERWLYLARTYGKHVIAVAVLIVLSTAGNVSWKHYQQHQAESQGGALFLAINKLSTGKHAEAIEELETLARKNTASGALAQMRLASNFLQEGKKEEARARYQDLQTKRGVPVEIKEMAKLLEATSYSSETATLSSEQKESIQKSLESLTAETSPWRFTAMEQLAFWNLEQGNNERAHALFAALLQNKETPESIKKRVEMIDSEKKQ